MTMSIIFIFTLICIISFSPLSYASYEYFIMAEQWAPAYCRSRQYSVSPLPSKFTNHNPRIVACKRHRSSAIYMPDRCSGGNFKEGNDNIWNGLNLVDILRQDGITPSPTGSYDRKQIREAISKHITLPTAPKDNYPELHCTPELAEIRLCLNHDGDQYIDCPNVGNCGLKIRWKP